MLADYRLIDSEPRAGSFDYYVIRCEMPRHQIPICPTDAN